MALTELNQVSIAEIVIYSFALVIGVVLSLRHGFGRNAGWLYLILFSIIRILGAAFNLATINDPSNINLYIGEAILQNIGISPLVLVLLALVGRVHASIRAHRSGLLQNQHLRLVQTIVLVGLILGIVGGSRSGASYVNGTNTPKRPETVAGLALITAGYGLLVIAFLLTMTQMRDADKGEHRLFFAVGVSLPFVLVRLIYSCLGTFANRRDFQSASVGGGRVDLLIGMSVVMEMVVIVVVEAVGMTLRRIPKGERLDAIQMQQNDRSSGGGLLSGLGGLLGRRRRQRRARRADRQGIGMNSVGYQGQYGRQEQGVA